MCVLRRDGAHGRKGAARENETAEVRILSPAKASTQLHGGFFLLRRPKVTRVTRVRSKGVCSSHELLLSAGLPPDCFRKLDEP